MTWINSSLINTRIGADSSNPASRVLPGLAFRDGFTVTGMIWHSGQVGVADVVVDAKVTVDGVGIGLSIRDVEADFNVVPVLEGHLSVGTAAFRVSGVGCEWCSLLNVGIGTCQCSVGVHRDSRSGDP